MGSNGSFASGSTTIEENRRWKTVMVLSNGVKIIELKNPKSNHKAPEESHKKNSIYVMYNKNGNGIKSISKYGTDGKKVFEIHTVDHKGLGIHYHPWHNGKAGNALRLTNAMKQLFDSINKMI